jgi:hypothetical protein
MSTFIEIIKAKSDAELTEIFIKNKGYQEEFMALVQEELVLRKIPIESLQKMREEQNSIDETKLESGIQGSQFWIVAAFIGSIFGGIWAIFAGYNYAYSKHKIKGREYYVYNESTRKYGRIMFSLGCIILILVLVGKLMK